jgi:hypothetical protein
LDKTGKLDTVSEEGGECDADKVDEVEDDQVENLSKVGRVGRRCRVRRK